MCQLELLCRYGRTREMKLFCCKAFGGFDAEICLVTLPSAFCANYAFDRIMRKIPMSALIACCRIIFLLSESLLTRRGTHRLRN